MNPEVLKGVIAILLILLLEFILIYKQPWVKRQANELLRDILSPEQHGQLIQQGHVDIPSPNHPECVYRIPWVPGYVQVREKGKLTMRLCLQPTVSVPAADIVVIHKLMIEADEETYLEKANRFC